VTPWPSLGEDWPHTTRFERIARGLFSVMCAVHAVIFLVRTRHIDGSVPRWWIFGLVLVSGAAALRPAARLLTVASMAGATVLTLLLPGETQESLQGNQGFLLCWAVALLWPRIQLVAATVVLLCVVTAVRWWRFGSGPGWSALDDTVIAIGVGTAVAVIRQAGLAGVMAADRAHAGAVRDRLREGLQAADSRAAKAAHEALHDDALGVLSAIGAAVGEDLLLAQRVGEVASRLEGDSAPPAATRLVSLPDVLSSLAAESRLQVSVGRFSGSQDWPALDDVHTGVIRRAVTEALRNVERHAGVETVRLDAAYERGWFRVDVSDPGRGFHPDEDAGWGRRHSIEEPIRSIAGRVHTASQHDSGTRVTLTWPITSGATRTGETRVARVYEQTRTAAPGAIPAVLAAVSGVLALHTYLAVRYSWGRPAMTAQLLDGFVIVGLSVWTLRRLRRSAPTWPFVVFIPVAVSAAVAGGLALAEPGSLRYYESFVVGMAGISLTAMAYFADAVTLAILVAPVATVLAVATIRDPVASAADSVGAYSAIAAPVLGAFAVGAFLRGVSRAVASEARRTAELSGAEYRIKAEEAARHRLTPFTREVVTPWLQAIADGRTRLDDPATKVRASELAQQVRDELYLGGALDSALRTRVAEARQQGLRIDFEARDGSVSPEAAIAFRLLDRLLDDPSGIERIRVGVPTTVARSWFLSVVSSPSAQPLKVLTAALSTVSHTVTADAFATTVGGTIGHMQDGQTSRGDG